jgi:DNA-binding transcriptional regulator/RsmH inhibitor MraZ
LQKEVILTSLTVKMELWDADAYQTEINRIDENEFEKLATERLGNINFANE